MTFNATTIKTPSELSIDVEDIVKAERNSKGDIVIERITTKRKLNMKWNYLTNAEMKVILELVVNNVFITVGYEDPVTGTTRSGTFYTGAKKGSTFRYSGGAAVGWKDVTFNAIER